MIAPAAEADCREQVDGGSPEVSDELIDAVVAFVRTPARATGHDAQRG